MKSQAVADPKAYDTEQRVTTEFCDETPRYSDRSYARPVPDSSKHPYVPSSVTLSGLADTIAAGTTIYVDGRFYICIDRFHFGGDRRDDILEFERVCFSPVSEWPIASCSARHLDDLERQGRAALIRRDGPGRAETCEAPQPQGPTRPIASLAGQVA
jgi:hypothetical protein